MSWIVIRLHSGCGDFCLILGTRAGAYLLDTGDECVVICAQYWGRGCGYICLLLGTRLWGIFAIIAEWLGEGIFEKKSGITTFNWTTFIEICRRFNEKRIEISKSWNHEMSWSVGKWKMSMSGFVSYSKILDMFLWWNFLDSSDELYRKMDQSYNTGKIVIESGEFSVSSAESFIEQKKLSRFLFFYP